MKYPNPPQLNNYSAKAFQYAIAVFIIFMMLICYIAFVAYFGVRYPDIVGVVFFVMIVLSIVGSSYSIKGIREKNTVRKIVGLIVNFGINILAIAVLLSNIVDIYRAVN